MAFFYNIAVWLGFLILAPRFLYDKLTHGKWAAGFSQRLGKVPAFNAAGRKVVLLHCVSVGEAHAALPLARKLKERYPDIALVVSTTTRTGQQVAHDSYADIAERVLYFPFDLRGSVRRFLQRVKPDLVLLTETELWFNFIDLVEGSGARVCIVNGRLSERSFRRYSRVKGFMRKMLDHVSLALMQTDADADRIRSLGMNQERVVVSGNLKFDLDVGVDNGTLTREFQKRFDLHAGLPLIIAASTHEPEERYVLESLDGELGHSCRLMLVLT